MGVVLLAHDEALDRLVAIKFTHPSRVGSGFRERFLDEARAMARISHPNVLQVYAFGEHVHASYIVMEYVAGRTLEQWLAEQRSPPDLDLALRILDEVCAGVAAIHAQNTVHHDIKPSNILLDARLRPRVADFGLAALLRRDQPRTSGRRRSDGPRPRMAQRAGGLNRSDVVRLGSCSRRSRCMTTRSNTS